MKVDKLIVSLVLTALLGLSGWTLLEVVNLKVGLARLDAKLESHMSGEKVAKR